MKSWFIVFTALLFCGFSSYVSADEYLYRVFGNSRLRLTALQAPSAGGFDDTADITTAYSGGISSASQYLELTPMIGYTFGGRFDYEEGDNEETIKISDASSYGFRLGYDLGLDSQIEFSYSRQETKL
ncbi:MAG: hypothetical protein ACYSUX_04625, partial [Planctomycetota bacterium]